MKSAVVPRLNDTVNAPSERGWIRGKSAHQSVKLKRMKPTKAAPNQPRRASKVPSQQAIIRAVASSTAIETGKSIGQIEKSLLSKNSKLRKIALAS